MEICDKGLMRDEFFSQGYELLVPSAKDNDLFRFYKLKETGQLICEIKMNLGLSQRIEIAQITDVHLNYCLSEELEDQEVNYTKQCRTWLANGESVKSITKAMDVAQYSDQTVITGDILDYLSAGAAELTKKHIFERDPEVICTVGGHDITKQMETGKPDELSAEERLSIIERFWVHDIFYFSKMVKDEIIVVGLNNGQGKYYPCQMERLRKDIKKAREENKFILLFQHEPISTNNPDDVNREPDFIASPSCTKPRNYYNSPMGRPNDSNVDTVEMYRLITESADVIKGIFCGHYHSFFYTEIKASSKAEPAVIPQITAMGNPYFKHVGVVTRIIID